MTKPPPDVMKRSLALVGKVTNHFEGQDDRVVGFTLALACALYCARNISVHENEAVLELQIETIRMMMPVARHIIEEAAKDDEPEQPRRHQ